MYLQWFYYNLALILLEDYEKRYGSLALLLFVDYFIFNAPVWDEPHDSDDYV